MLWSCLPSASMTVHALTVLCCGLAVCRCLPFCRLPPQVYAQQIESLQAREAAALNKAQVHGVGASSHSPHSCCHTPLASLSR